MPSSLPPAAPPPTRLQSWLVSPLVHNGILALIIINAVILGLETSPAAMRAWGPALLALDQAILAVFVVEIALRIVAHRGAFFRDA